MSMVADTIIYAYWTIRRQTNSRAFRSQTGQHANNNFFLSWKDDNIFVQ